MISTLTPVSPAPSPPPHHLRLQMADRPRRNLHHRAPDSAAAARHCPSPGPPRSPPPSTPPPAANALPDKRRLTRAGRRKPRSAPAGAPPKNPRFRSASRRSLSRIARRTCTVRRSFPPSAPARRARAHDCAGGHGHARDRVPAVFVPMIMGACPCRILSGSPHPQSLHITQSPTCYFHFPAPAQLSAQAVASGHSASMSSTRTPGCTPRTRTAPARAQSPAPPLRAVPGVSAANGKLQRVRHHPASAPRSAAGSRAPGRSRPPAPASAATFSALCIMDNSCISSTLQGISPYPRIQMNSAARPICALPQIK